MLRSGAILCPHCDTKVWKLSKGDAEPPAEMMGQSVEDGPVPASISDAGKPAVLSLVVAAIALGGRILLPVMASRTSQLSLLLTVLVWGTTVLGVYAVYLARRAENRLDGTRDRRGLMAARCGLILGMATIAYAASSFVTSSIDHVVGSLQS